MWRVCTSLLSTEGCGLLICRNGETFVGGIEGMSSFMNSSLQKIAPNYNLYFSSLVVNNRVISVGTDDGILKSAFTLCPTNRVEPQRE